MNVRQTKITTKDILNKFPHLEKSLQKFGKRQVITRKMMQVQILHLSFLAMEIRKGLGAYQHFYLMVMFDVLRVGKQSAYNYLNCAAHCMSECKCLENKSISEIVEMFEAKNSNIADIILEELNGKFPEFSIKDFYTKELPEPKEKKPILKPLPHETLQVMCESEYDYATRTITKWTSPNVEEQLWRHFGADKIRELIEGFRTLADEMDNALNGNDSDNLTQENNNEN